MQTKLNVEGMSCNHCANTVKNAVLTVNGVTDVTVDFGKKTVTVTHDENTVLYGIKMTIEQSGFKI